MPHRLLPHLKLPGSYHRPSDRVVGSRQASTALLALSKSLPTAHGCRALAALIASGRRHVDVRSLPQSKGTASPSPLYCSPPEKLIREALRVERMDLVDALAVAHKVHRQLELMRQRDDHAALIKQTTRLRQSRKSSLHKNPLNPVSGRKCACMRVACMRVRTHEVCVCAQLQKHYGSVPSHSNPSS